MCAKVKAPTIPSGQDFHIVRHNGKLDNDFPLLFTFSNFRMNPINIPEVFNNHFKDLDEFIRKVSILLGKALPLLSMETSSLFNDCSKSKQFHLHKLTGKEDILFQIFKTYCFSPEAIDNFIDGAEIYQLELPYENGATRIVFERIENLISFLFLDPNHHIYMNHKFVDQNHSLFYEYCPVNEADDCPRMTYLQTCFAFEFLDKEAYEKTYGFDYSPQS